MNISLKNVFVFLLTAMMIAVLFSGCGDSASDMYSYAPPATSEATVPPTTESNYAKLTGRWKLIEDSFEYDEEYVYYDGVFIDFENETEEMDELTEFKTFEFFEDGQYDSNQANYQGSYSLTYNRIRLYGVLVKTLVYTFEIDGNILTLSAGEHDEISLSFKQVG